MAQVKVESISAGGGIAMDPQQVVAAFSVWSRMNLGWRDAVADAEGGRVIARIGSNRVVRKLIVRLNGKDLYDIEIGRVKRGSYEWVIEGQVFDIYADQLAEEAIALHGRVAG